MKRFSSVKTKLSLWFTGTLALIIIVFSIALYTGLARSLENGLNASLETLAKKRHSDILEGMRIMNSPEIHWEEIQDIEELDEEKDLFPIVYAQLLVVPGDGNVEKIKILAKSKNLDQNRLPFLSFKKNWQKKIHFSNVTVPFHPGIPMKMASYPFELDKKKNTFGVVQFLISRKEVDNTLDTLLMIILIIDPILLFFSFFGGYFLVNKTFKPVKQVVESAKRITADDLFLRIPSSGSRDEIGELVDTLNNMIARLERSFNKIKQFSADVSHEFKTPLAIIRGEIDVVLRKKRDDKKYIDTLKSIHEETLGLQRIIDNILLLGDAEAEGDNLPFETFALDKLVMDVFENIQPLTKEKNTRFVVAKIDRVEIKGVAVLLERVFMNLFENAVKYSHDEGTVEFMLVNEEKFAKFSIKDSGTGIPGEELPFIFDRFYRVDKSRSRRKQSVGLGLAIVKEIVHLHNGSIYVSSSPGKGSMFSVRLPFEHTVPASPAP